MRILRHLLLLAATAAASHAAHAATPAGTLDPTFGDGGKRTIPLDSFPVTRGSRVLLGPGGNIYAVGTGDPSAQPNDSGIVLSRLTPAGAIDTS